MMDCELALCRFSGHLALKLKEIKALPAQAVSCCVDDKHKKLCSTYMATFHTCLIVGPIRLFDCLADPVVHLLLKSSMVRVKRSPWLLEICPSAHFLWRCSGNE